MNDIVQIKLTTNGVNYILSLLADAPYRYAAPLVDEIHAQAKPQLEAMQQSHPHRIDEFHVKK